LYLTNSSTPEQEEIHEECGSCQTLKLKAEIIKQRISQEQVAEFLQTQPEVLWNPISEKPVTWDAETNELHLDLLINEEDVQSQRMKISF